jgi:hypothetical protein
MDRDGEVKARLARIRDRLRITKVVATRAVKGRHGDSFAGFSAAWETIQDDAGGPGAELISSVPSEEIVSQGMTLQEARIAHLLVAMQTDIAAHEAAIAGGNISDTEGQARIRTIKSNYGRLVRKALGPSDTEVNGNVESKE